MKYIVVETKEEKRCVKSKQTAATANQVEKRFWEEDEACDRRRQEAEDDALNSWKNNRKLWRGSKVDKEMALLRERVKMRQMQEKLSLVTQPVIQSRPKLVTTIEWVTCKLACDIHTRDYYLN